MPNAPATIIDGVTITKKYDDEKKCTVVTGTRTAVGGGSHTASLPVPDGDCYPELALRNAAEACARRVNNAMADGGPAKPKA